jgi:peptidoglycan LD-endopeptidase LytH
VQQGQDVRAGDTIGLIGNTGNARNTPPHLHFGIYSSSGPIDPLPFVKRDREEVKPISVPLDPIADTVRSEKNTVLYLMPDQKSPKSPLTDVNTLLQVKAATDTWYKVQLPDGTEGFVLGNSVTSASDALRSITLSEPKAMFDKPDSLMAARKTVLIAKEKVEVLGVFKNYYYVRNGKESGWVTK